MQAQTNPIMHLDLHRVNLWCYESKKHPEKVKSLEAAIANGDDIAPVFVGVVDENNYYLLSNMELGGDHPNLAGHTRAMAYFRTNTPMPAIVKHKSSKIPDHCSVHVKNIELDDRYAGDDLFRRIPNTDYR